MTRGLLYLNRADVYDLLDMATAIDVIEAAFKARADGTGGPTGVLGTHAGPGGFHVKAAIQSTPGPYYAAKINSNFPENPAQRSLPTIQGLVVLFDAVTGAPLAVMDSVSITILRTAAATGVAARYCARPGATTMTLVGCGAQAEAQVRAVRTVRPITRVLAHDRQPGRAEAFAKEAATALRISVEPADQLEAATRASEIVVTCTTARRAFLGPADVQAGAFVAAVGADNEEKQEIAPALLAAARVVVDLREQCAAFGDLHHALAAGVMRMDDVHADLAEIVAGQKPGRVSPEEVVVFDSTGVALEDVAAAAAVYHQAVRSGRGVVLALR